MLASVNFFHAHSLYIVLLGFEISQHERRTFLTWGRRDPVPSRCQFDSFLVEKDFLMQLRFPKRKFDYQNDSDCHYSPQRKLLGLTMWLIFSTFLFSFARSSFWLKSVFPLITYCKLRMETLRGILCAYSTLKGHPKRSFIHLSHFTQILNESDISRPQA